MDRLGCAYYGGLNPSDVEPNGAYVSECGAYRYGLWRTVNEDNPLALAFVMLNPSTADAEKDDPTVRRCMDFTRRFGFGRLVVVNLFAYRATDPQDMLRAHSEGVDIVGPENDAALLDALLEDVVVAFSSVAPRLTRPRWEAVWNLHRARLAEPPRPVNCLRLSASGYPYHPLYLRADLTPIPFPSWEEA